MPKYDLHFDPPVLNAAGFLGFAPDHHGPVDLKQLGMFITNPISLEARSPASGTKLIPFAGGFLLHTGHPNDGLRRVLKSFSGRWTRSSVPVIVHLLGEGPDQAKKAVQMLENREGIAALELGLPPDIDPHSAQQLAAAALGELPLIVRLPVERALEFARALENSDAAAFSLAPVRGCLKDAQGHLVYGRLYGPSQFPLTLGAVKSLANGPVPIIGAGGIYSADQIEATLSAGALAVQVDGILWRNPEML